MKVFTLIFLSVIICFTASAQKKKTKVEIKNTKVFHFTKIDGKEVRKLIGNVILKHGEVMMYCDSAYQYVNLGYFDAFNHVRIEQGDSIQLTGDFLNYNESEKLALVKDNVVLREKGMTLRTDVLFYNMKENIAYYTSGAEIINDQDRLLSNTGYYYASSKDLFFKDSVRLFNPDYSMYSDTLRYQTTSDVAYFYGPTKIISDENTIYCENGWYNTKSDKAKFGKNAYLVSKGQFLYGDSLFYNRNLGYGRAKNNIRLVDTAEKLTVYGQYAEMFEKKDKTFITDSALVEKRYKADTFFMHSDTLLATKDSSGKNKVIHAFYDVRSFSRNFQSRCDSLIYSFKDSVIYLYHNPIMWFGEYQVTGDEIQLFTNGPEVEKIIVTNNAFIIGQVDSQRFNQINGKNLTGYIKNNDLRRVDIKGNGQAVYYALDDKKKFVGINKIESSDIKVFIKEQEIQKINFINKPVATVFPVGAKRPEEMRLKNFNWRFGERPNSVKALFLQRKKLTQALQDE